MSIIDVLADDVMLVLPMVAAKLELLDDVPILTVEGNVRVTPDGRLLNVNRICVELCTRVPSLLPFCDLLLQQLAHPSVRINAPNDRAMFLLVKIVAAPAPTPALINVMVELPGARPIAADAMPGFNVLMIVPDEGEPNR